MTIGEIKCPICYAAIQVTEIPDYCPACKEYIREKLEKQAGPGLATATAVGPGLNPHGGVIKETNG